MHSDRTGTHNGGTFVFLRGANFSDVTAELSGIKHETSVSLVTATEVNVKTPSASGRVVVKVTAIGGTSVATAGSHYHYA
jgi:hypothetical protein